MKYTLDQKALQKAIAERGYRSVSAFARAAKLHRNTVNNLLQGQGVFTSSVQHIADRLQCDPTTLICPSSTTTAQLPCLDELRPMLAQLLQRVPTVAVVLFGSRARGHAAQFADWDLGLMRRPTPLTHREFAQHKSWIDDQTENIVRVIDVVNLHAAPLWFLTHIADDARLLDGNVATWSYFQGVLDGLRKTRQTQ